MGQRWSMIKYGFLEESESEEESESLTQLQHSQAMTEASSSVAAFDNRELWSICPNDIEIDDAMVVAFLDRLLKFKIILTKNLSKLQSDEATVDTRRGTTPTLSTSHFSSVKGSLKDFEAPCTLRPRKLGLDCKLEAYREALHGQFAIRKLGANAGAAKSMDVAKFMDVTKHAAGEDEMLHSCPKLEDRVMIGKKRKLMQSTVVQPPFSPAETLLMFQLDPKRKRSAGLPSLAFDYTGCPATYMKQKAEIPLEGPSKGVVAGEAVLDLGTGDAMVGRSVKKVIEGQRECRRGHVSCYNAAQRLYQIKYDDGKEEELEWLDLEPNLIARGRARTRPRYKTVNELVYTKPKRPAKQRRIQRR